MAVTLLIRLCSSFANFLCVRSVVSRGRSPGVNRITHIEFIQRDVVVCCVFQFRCAGHNERDACHRHFAAMVTIDDQILDRATYMNLW